jgi:hypothetical protein
MRDREGHAKSIPLRSVSGHSSCGLRIRLKISLDRKVSPNQELAVDICVQVVLIDLRWLALSSRPPSPDPAEIQIVHDRKQPCPDFGVIPTYTQQTERMY